MPNYSYFYTRAIESNNGDVKTTKFLKGDPALLKLPDDVWETLGKYRLLSRILRGGISGSGDIHHPANAVFKGLFFEKFLGSLPSLRDGFPSGYARRSAM